MASKGNRGFWANNLSPGFANRFFSGALAGVATDMVSGLAGGASRLATYAGNVIVPNVIPDFAALCDLQNRGWIWGNALPDFARKNGVNFEFQERTTWEDDIWRIIYQSSKKDFTVEEAIYLWRIDAITEEQLDAILLNNGWDAGWKRQKIKQWRQYPSSDVAIAMYRQGITNLEMVYKSFQAEGQWDAAKIEDVLKLSSTIGADDVYRMHMKGYFSVPYLTKLLERSGIVSDEDKANSLAAWNVDPGASDLIRFALREVWDKNVVARFGYDEEFDSIPQFKWWMNAAGYRGSPQPDDYPQNPYAGQDQPPIIGPNGQPLPQAPELETWAQAYWRAHWDLPSPTQGYQFLHRLRPDRIAKYQQLIPGVQPWTIDDMRLLLKTADYPKPFRDRLAAVSYHTLTRVDIRRLYDMDVIDEKEVMEQNLDAGYNTDDARYLTQYIVKEKRLRKLRKQREREQKRTIRLLGLGIISKDDASNRLEKLGLSQVAAQAEVSASVLDSEEKTIVLAMKAIHRQYVRWDMSADVAKSRLRRIGIIEESVQKHLHEWDLERDANGRRSTANMIAKWVVRGLIPPGAAIRRIVNMGYAQSDAIRIVKVASQDAGVSQARADRMAATNARTAAAAAERELLALQRQVERATKEIVKASTPARLAKWYKKGLIDYRTVEARLRVQGWQLDDIKRLLGIDPFASQVVPDTSGPTLPGEL